jgi:hypothetical protein
VKVRGTTICEAIRGRLILEFDYDGRHRVVEPYCHGISRAGRECLRAVQIAGESRSGGFGHGKLWSVAKMRNVHASATAFVARDPEYNPADTAMVEIHCRIE